MTAAPGRQGDAAARRFAWMWLRVELACVLSKALVRPATAMLITSAAVLTALLNHTMQLLMGSPAAALVVAFLVAAALAAVIYSLTALWVEARNFTAATHRWLLPIGDGWAGAYAKPDRRGQLMLYSVWACPRHQHLGSALMRQVCAEMDALGCDLQLVAVNRGVVSFYRRFGFQQVRDGRFACRMVRRAHASHPHC